MNKKYCCRCWRPVSRYVKRSASPTTRVKSTEVIKTIGNLYIKDEVISSEIRSSGMKSGVAPRKIEFLDYTAVKTSKLAKLDSGLSTRLYLITDVT